MRQCFTPTPVSCQAAAYKEGQCADSGSGWAKVQGPGEGKQLKGGLVTVILFLLISKDNSSSASHLQDKRMGIWRVCVFTVRGKQGRHHHLRLLGKGGSLEEALFKKG